MIVDTSALIALVRQEPGSTDIFEALLHEDGLLPAPALVQFHRVVSRRPAIQAVDAEAAIARLLTGKLQVLPFTPEHGRAAVAANALYGIGNVRGGSLNLLDLMVYGCAKVLERPILCTGRDFDATDAAIHSASRIG